MHTHIYTHLKLQTQSGRIHQDSVLHWLAVGQNSAQRLRRWFCTLTLERRGLWRERRAQGNHTEQKSTRKPCRYVQLSPWLYLGLLTTARRRGLASRLTGTFQPVCELCAGTQHVFVLQKKEIITTFKNRFRPRITNSHSGHMTNFPPPYFF